VTRPIIRLQRQALDECTDELTCAEFDDAMARNGVLIIPRWQANISPLLQGLKNIAQQVGMVKPIRVTVSQAGADE